MSEDTWTPERRDAFRKAEGMMYAIVYMVWDGRDLIGHVRGLAREPGDGDSVYRLSVRHFNGEMWPVNPLPSDVEVV